MNRISVLFFLVDLCFSYLYIHEIGKLHVMCVIPLSQMITITTPQQYIGYANLHTIATDAAIA